MEESSWRSHHGGGIMEESSWRSHHGGVIMEETSWRSHHGGVIMEESSWRSHHEGVIKEESSWRSHHGAWRRYHGGVWELSGGSLEALWGLSGGSLEAGVALGWPWGDLGLGGAFCIVKHSQHKKQKSIRARVVTAKMDLKATLVETRAKNKGTNTQTLKNKKHRLLKL